jgi:DNA helicase-2/ATP-dependent DNA helicase PcrA
LQYPSDALNDLNPEQLAAVQHGTGDEAHDTRPLLVIAGAGSGKTNTLAHRVANLIRHGADPQRIMLLTFSRRAAQEMERRVGSVLQKALGLPATQALPNLPGPAPSTASGHACCANMRCASAWTNRSRSTTAATPRT